MIIHQVLKILLLVYSKTRVLNPVSVGIEKLESSGGGGGPSEMKQNEATETCEGSK